LTWTAPLAAVAGELMNTQLWDPLADDLMLLGYKPMGEMTGGTQTIAFSTFARLDAVNTILDQDPSGLSLARTSDFTTAQFQGELFHEYTIRTAGWYIFEGQIQLTTDTVTAGGRQVNLYYNNGAFFTSIRTNQTVPWTLGWTSPPIYCLPGVFLAAQFEASGSSGSVVTFGTNPAQAMFSSVTWISE
jgi:hypothetical protein